jgi:hypothetical protein
MSKQSPQGAVYAEESHAEVINFFNRPNFGGATQTLARGLGAGGANGGLSPLYQFGGPRSVQLAVRLQF